MLSSAKNNVISSVHVFTARHVVGLICRSPYCIFTQVRREVDLMRSKHGAVPGLAVIMVGERRDSAKYVSMKQARVHNRCDDTCTYLGCIW